MRLRPDFYLIHYNLGVSLFMKQRYAEAVSPLTEALRLQGNEAEVHHLLAQSYGNIGKFDEAVRHHREALFFRPDWAVPMNNLAWLLATTEAPKIRDGAEAVRLARRACELTGYRDVSNLDTLAASFAEAGNFAEAIRMEQVTLDLGRSSKLNAAQIRDFQDRLALYRKNLPYRDHATSAR
jgi:Flp pilus assembly protein TadD